MKASTAAVLVGALCVTAACASGGDRGPRMPSGDPVRVLLSADALVFAAYDANGDLSISTAERDAAIAAEWARADENSDGALTPIEFQAWVSAALGGSNAPPYRLDFDRNVDNSITREEFETELRSRFDDYDANDDGSVVRAEFLRETQLRPQVVREPRDEMRPADPYRRPPGT